MRLIDADALLDDLVFSSEALKNTFTELINDTPTVETERKKGKWIYEGYTFVSGTCSCCGWDAIVGETDVAGMPFCPKCGAEMEN